MNQYTLKYQAVFSAGLDTQGKNDPALDENEIYINLEENQKLTQSDIDNIDIQSRIDGQLQFQETKDSGWRFEKISWITRFSMKPVK